MENFCEQINFGLTQALDMIWIFVCHNQKFITGPQSQKIIATNIKFLRMDTDGTNFLLHTSHFMLIGVMLS